VSWCSQGPRRLDCLRGVALSWGHRPAEQAYGLRGLAPDGGPSRVPSQLRRRCSSLARAAGDASGALKESCFFGLGFGLSDQTLRRLAKGVRSCEGLALRPEEVRACRRGVGWGQAQNFWNRPGAMRRWLGEQLRGQARIDSAEGIGVLLAMLSRDPAWVRSECAAQVPPDSIDACRRGAASNRRFMPEEEP